MYGHDHCFCLTFAWSFLYPKALYYFQCNETLNTAKFNNYSKNAKGNKMKVILVKIT